MKQRRHGYPVAADDTCVLYMPFEDNFGTAYLDRSQYANHGVRTGAVQCNGIQGLGLSFDGTDDYVSVADSASLDCAAVTIAAWVKLDATWAAAGYVLVKCEDNAPGGEFSYGLVLTNLREIELLISDDGDTPATEETSTGALSVSTWHHVAATFAGGTYLIYANGVLVASDGNGAEASIYVGTGRVTIGARWDIAQSHLEFKGLIDEPMVFNRALSAQEINELYLVHAGDNTRE